MNGNRTILITGASGFLGTWLADEAFKAGYTLVGVDLRAPLKPGIWSAFATASCENVDWDNLLNGVSLHAICHLAGGASVLASVNDPYADFSSLLPGTVKLALYITKFQKQARIFLFSSAAVYGNPLTLPINEDTPVLPISPYGIHKSMAESILLNYARVFGLSVTIFRVFSVYGVGLRKQLIWDVCNRAISAAAKGEKEIILFGTGNETRDFIYVEDLCEAVITLVNMHSDNETKVYNIASGKESSISEVANCLVKHLNVDLDIKFDGNVPKGDPANWSADIERLSGVGFKTKHSLDEGLKHVASWIKDSSK